MTSQTKPPEVPASQKVEKVLRTNFNHTFAQKIKALKPKLHEWIDRPLSVFRFEPDDESFFKCKMVSTQTIDELPSILYGRGDQLILDFGSHRVCYLSFHLGVDGVNIDAPARLRLTFREIPYDVTEHLHPCNTWISTSWLPDETINVDWLPTDVEVSRRYTFRYVKVEIADTSPKFKVRFSEVKARAVSAVSQARASAVEPFETDDEELAPLDRISQVTLRNCMQTVFEDGPRRDRRLWLGDLRLQALTNYCRFKDYALVKRCLYMFAALPREDGSLPACVFEKPKLSPKSDCIVDYDAHFGPTVYDYIVASGDVETATALWPTILGSMQKPLSHLDPISSRFHSAANPAWKFLDWSTAAADEDAALDTDAGMHSLLLYSRTAINALAAHIAQPAPFPRTLIAALTAAATSFYDSARAVFVSGSARQVFWTSQAWLTLGGALDAPTCLRAIRSAMADPGAVWPLTLYAHHHVVEALARCGGEGDAMALVKAYWGGMVGGGGGCVLGVL